MKQCAMGFKIKFNKRLVRNFSFWAMSNDYDGDSDDGVEHTHWEPGIDWWNCKWR